MNSNTIFKLAMVLAVLALVWFGQAWWRDRQVANNSGWSKLQSEIKAEEVDKIRVGTEGGQLEFVKSGEEWLLDQDKADKLKIQSLLDLLNEPEVELVSQNQERHAELGLATGAANELGYLVGADEKFSLLVDRQTSRLIRQKDKQNVYRLTTSLSLAGDKSMWLEATPSATLSPPPAE